VRDLTRSLSEPLMRVLCAWESAWSHPPWRTVPVLLLGTLVARGRRTVPAALRQRGWPEASHVSLSQHVRHRARRSALGVRRCLLVLWVRTLVAVGGALPVGIDARLERRGGRGLATRGPAREPLASSQQGAVATSAGRWIGLTWVITPPGHGGRGPCPGCVGLPRPLR
jgi:hypothetical protein